MTECANHQGGYDCTPFCNLCEGNQEYETKEITKMGTWTHTPELDISFEHCGVPAYWEEDSVYCSKCQDTLEEPHQGLLFS